MDSKGLLEQQKRISVPITEGGIHIDTGDKQEQLKRIMTVHNMDVHQQMEEQKRLEEQRRKNINKDNNNNNGNKQVHLKNDDNVSEASFIRGLKDEENRELVEDGIDLFGEVDEHEILLDNNDIEDLLNQSARVPETRLNRYVEYPVLARKQAIKAGHLLRNSSEIVKKGRFDDAAVAVGQAFVRQIGQWAGIPQVIQGDEARFYKEIGIKDRLDFLYVDGMPLREFVSKRYGYNGSRDKQKERGILSAYVAMIAKRQNHPITLVRPTLTDGVADVEIRDVTVDTEERRREDRIRNVRNALEGEKYRKYCETAYRADMRAKAGRAARKISGREIESLNRLEALKNALNATEKGKHKDYDDFVMAFNAYFNALEFIGLDPEHMEVSKGDLQILYRLNESAKSCAIVYLRGKKMNLGRHTAIRDIRDMLSEQSGVFWGVLKSGALEEGESLSLKDILDREDEGYVVMGIEEEINDLKSASIGKNDDKNDYEQLTDDIGVSVRQKTVLKMKNTINSNKAANQAFVRMAQTIGDDATDEQVRQGYAYTFLKAAANAILSNEVYNEKLKRRFAYAADDRDLLITIVARDQLSKLYPDEFRNFPALQTALDMLNSDVAAREAKALTYYNSTLGKKVSKEEFEKNGGSAGHFYVTADEANAIKEKSNGFLVPRQIQGNDKVVEMVHSLPEYTTIYSGQENNAQQPVALRKTIKTMFRAFSYYLTGENGRMKTQVDSFGDATFTEWFDRALRTSSSYSSKQEINDLEAFLNTAFKPVIAKMLQAEYKKKGISDAKRKAAEEAGNVCRDYFTLIKGGLDFFLSGTPGGPYFDFFRKAARTMDEITTDTLMADAEFEKVRLNGEAPSREEVDEALSELKTEMSGNVDELLKIKDVDADDPFVPGISACGDQAQFDQVMMQSFATTESHNRLQYSLSTQIKKDPMKAFDDVVANLDNILNTGVFKKREEKRAYILKLNEIRKTRELTPVEIAGFRSSMIEGMKYDWHGGSNICKIGNSQYTVETYAATPEKIFSSPLTMDVHIGKYNSDKEMEMGDMGEMYHEGMNSYYNHDDIFSHCRTRKSALKCQLKETIRSIIAKQ